MKHFKTLLFPLLICSLLITSCKDTDKDPNPCDDAVTVMAADISQHGYAHFIGDNTLSSFAPTKVYYLAKNWKDFSSKVVPGKLYKLAFKEVACEWGMTGSFGETDTSTKIGRCGTPVNKCIEIVCLTETIAQATNNCFGINFAPEDFSHYFSRAIKPATISNHSLQTEANFSGCSADDAVSFRLLISELPTQHPGDPLVFEAKVEEINKGFTCQAVFNKPVCFDLSTLPLHFTKNNIAIPDQVTIRFHYGNQENNITYQPLK